MEKNKIKFVAIYLRKSRQSSEDELKNHRIELERICKEKEWDYKIYEEYGTSTSIDARPIMKQLLLDIEQDKYDAVFTYDYDRLGRGKSADTEKMFSVFRDSNTLLICANPFKIYDFSIDENEYSLEFLAFFARWEYKLIHKRLAEGKKTHLNRGHWVFGSAPYGYSLDKKEKKLVAKEIEKKTFREIVELFLEGYSETSIAKKLNDNGVLSPKGKNWNSSTIRRLLSSKLYLGHTVYNKSIGNRYEKDQKASNAFKNLSKDQWRIKENTHEPLLSLKEYNKISNKLDINNKDTYFFDTIHPYSNLTKCGICKKTMVNRFDKLNNVILSACSCGNKGGNTIYLKDAIQHASLAFVNNTEKNINEGVFEQRKKELEEDLNQMYKSQKIYKTELKDIENQFEKGLCDIETVMKISKSKKECIENLKEDIILKKRKVLQLDILKIKSKVDAVNYYLNIDKEKLDSKSMNVIYKSFIKEILVVKTDEEMKFEIHFF